MTPEQASGGFADTSIRAARLMHGQAGSQPAASHGIRLMGSTQGGMYIRGAMKIVLVAPAKNSHTYLEDGPTPLLDLY